MQDSAMSFDIMSGSSPLRVYLLRQNRFAIQIKYAAFSANKTQYHLASQPDTQPRFGYLRLCFLNLQMIHTNSASDYSAVGDSPNKNL